MTKTKYMRTYPSKSVALSLADISFSVNDSELEVPCFSMAKKPYFAISLYLVQYRKTK